MTLVLNEGEVICPKCNGSGLCDNNYIPDVPVFGVYTCFKCNGKGKLDWIENIKGPNNPITLKLIRMTKHEYEIRRRRGIVPKM